MDLTDLKNIWTEVIEEDRSVYSISERDIKNVIFKKSNTLFSKIIGELRPKRWLMGIIGVLTIVFSGVYLIETDDNYVLSNVFSRVEMALFTFLLGFVILILFVNIERSYRKFKKFEESAPDLKSALSTSRSLLLGIQKLAVFSDVSIIPIIIGSFTFRKLFGEQPFVCDERVIYVALSVGASFLFLILLSSTIQKRKFGKYIQQAEQHLVDLDAIQKNKSSKV